MIGDGNILKSRSPWIRVPGMLLQHRFYILASRRVLLLKKPWLDLEFEACEVAFKTTQVGVAVGAIVLASSAKLEINHLQPKYSSPRLHQNFSKIKNHVCPNLVRIFWDKTC